MDGAFAMLGKTRKFHRASIEQSFCENYNMEKERAEI